LNIFDFAWFWPINNGLNFGLVHEKSIRAEDVAKVFHGGLVKFALVGICIEAMFSESPKDFFDMLFVLGHVIRIDKNVVKVDDD